MLHYLMIWSGWVTLNELLDNDGVVWRQYNASKYQLLEMNNKKDDLLFWYHKTTSPVPVQGDDSFLLWANTICLVQWFDDYELIRYTINPSDIYLFII